MGDENLFLHGNIMVNNNFFVEETKFLNANPLVWLLPNFQMLIH